MIWLVPATAGLFGVVIGLTVAIWFEPSAIVTRIVVLIGLALATLTPVVGWLAPVAAICVGGSMGIAGVPIWWHSTDPARRRGAEVFDDRTRREIVWHELIGKPPVILMVLPVIGAGLGAGVGVWAGAVASALVAAGAGAFATRDRSASSVAVIPTVVEGLVEAGDAAERSKIMNVLAAGRSGAAVVMYPPVVFRGLVGWNLGLGLDAERAVWAAQIAWQCELGDLLSQPDVELDEGQIAVLVTCRAMAARDCRPVFELSRDIPQATLRRMARVVADHRGERTITVVSDEPSLGRAFLTRSH